MVSSGTAHQAAKMCPGAAKGCYRPGMQQEGASRRRHSRRGRHSTGCWGTSSGGNSRLAVPFGCSRCCEPFECAVAAHRRPCLRGGQAAAAGRRRSCQRALRRGPCSSESHKCPSVHQRPNPRAWRMLHWPIAFLQHWTSATAIGRGVPVVIAVNIAAKQPPRTTGPAAQLPRAPPALPPLGSPASARFGIMPLLGCNRASTTSTAEKVWLVCPAQGLVRVVCAAAGRWRDSAAQ